MWVVLDNGGDNDMPDAYGPFDDRAKAVEWAEKWINEDMDHGEEPLKLGEVEGIAVKLVRKPS